MLLSAFCHYSFWSQVGGGRTKLKTSPPDKIKVCDIMWQKHFGREKTLQIHELRWLKNSNQTDIVPLFLTYSKKKSFSDFQNRGQFLIRHLYAKTSWFSGRTFRSCCFWSHCFSEIWSGQFEQTIHEFEVSTKNKMLHSSSYTQTGL